MTAPKNEIFYNTCDAVGTMHLYISNLPLQNDLTIITVHTLVGYFIDYPHHRNYPRSGNQLLAPTVVPSISLGTPYILQEHYVTAIYTCFWFKYFVRCLNNDKQLEHLCRTPISLYMPKICWTIISQRRSA